MNDLKIIYTLFRKYYTGYWLKIFIWFILIIIGSSISLLVPYLSRIYFDKVITNNSIHLLVAVTISILLSYMSVYILTNISRYKMSIINVMIQKKMRLDFTRGINEMKILEFYKKTPNYLYNRVLSDSMLIQSSMIEAVTSIFNNLYIIIIGVVFICRINIQLSVIITFFMILSALLSIRMGKLMQRYQLEFAEKLTEYNIVLSEAISSTFLSKIFNLVSFFQKKIKDIFELFIITVKDSKKKALTNSMFLKFINYSSEVLILLIGGYYIINNKITIGDLVAFMALFKLISTPIHAVILEVMNFKKNMPIFNRINELLNFEPDSNFVVVSVSIKKSIKLIDCHFSYSKDIILERVNYEFKPNRVYLIQGHSGAGKSTLAHLLFGMFSLSEGNIYFDSTELEYSNIRSYREKIAFIEQEPTIINDTLYNNLILGNLNAGMNEVRKVAKQAYVDEFVDKLPLGYKTVLGKGGQELSTGQKQRIAIARALLKTPDLYLFDEPTSNIDPLSAELIHKTIRKISENAFVIVISHQRELTKIADVCLEIKNKRLFARKMERTF